ncbi:MAG: type VI secretion system tube protein Hcp [Polyangiaceae bacterium]|nr:type VI secretion system tube protein Hcp [Polyangiaceae bacterium]
MKIEGVTQGPFKGESKRNEKAEYLTGLAFKHEIKSPRDPATGMPSGKRQHGPITIVKEWGASSPQIMYAVCRNEILKSVVFEFFNTSDEGNEQMYMKITLENATISRVNGTTGGANSENSAKSTVQWDTMELEEVEFTYQKITLEDMLQQTVAHDDWKEQAGGS